MSTSSIRLAHVADPHLGSGYHLGDEDRGGVNSRLRDFRDAWVRSCEQMVTEGVDLVLFAGDAFRDSKPSPTEQQAFRDGLDVLCDAEIPMVAIVGNHDLPRAPGRTHALAIFDGYRDYVMVVDRPQVIAGDGITVPLPKLPIPIACLPWPSRAHLAAADPEFERLTIDEQNARIVELSLAVLRKLGAEAEAAAGPLGCVLLAHGSIAGSAVGAAGSTQFFREPVLPLSELRGLPFRYQAWGHLHRAQDLEPHIRYAGSLERLDFAEATEDKGWWLIDLSTNADSGGCTFGTAWRSSNPRPFVDLELTEPTAWEAGVASLNGALPGAIVRVRYEATPEQARAVDHAGIRRALYQGGALKVHGPIATLRHAVAERESTLSEETDVLTGWQEYANGQGLTGAQRERLDRLVHDALGVLA